MSKEVSDKDRSMKTQLLMSTNTDEKISGEKVWKKNGFFGEIKPEMNIEKVNMPENTLFYMNQGYISTVKNGDLAMYIHNFIIGQILIAANQPEDISTYECKDNETKLLTCVYDLETGNFKGLRLMLAYIIIRGDDDEFFFSYGYSKTKSKVLYSHMKQQIPDTFIATGFNKHFKEIINEKRCENSSEMFYYLPSISDRKEEINQYKSNVSLTPIDVTIDFIKSFSDDRNFNFRPDLLNSPSPDQREPHVKVLRLLFKQIASFSNHNLQRNVLYLNMKSDRDPIEMECSGISQFNSKKFKLTY